MSDSGLLGLLFVLQINLNIGFALLISTIQAKSRKDRQVFKLKSREQTQQVR